MKFIRKIYILSDGSLYFSYELQTSDNTFVSCSVEDEKTFFLNKKNRVRQLNLKSSLEYKKKYFKQKNLEYSQVARHSFLVRAFKGSNPFIPIVIRKWQT